MAFYKEKGWWKSKTVWTGIVGAAFGVAALFGVPVPVELSEQVVGGIMTIVGLLTVFFRSTADTKLVTSETTV